MKITNLSKTKIEKACLLIKTKRDSVIKDVVLGAPRPESVMAAFKRLSSQFTSERIRLDSDNYKGGVALLDLDYVMGGEDTGIWAIMILAHADEPPLMKAWWDAEGHAHIVTNYGSYSTCIKYASVEDVANWIIEYLRLQ